jgi:uncharacterized Zn finger protein
MYTGIDYFAPKPGTVQSMSCKACSEVMDVERDVFTDTGYHRADVFKCKNSGLGWHRQIVDLIQEQNKSACTRIREIIQEEIDDIRLSKKATLNYKDYLV